MARNEVGGLLPLMVVAAVEAGRPAVLRQLGLDQRLLVADGQAIGLIARDHGKTTSVGSATAPVSLLLR